MEETKHIKISEYNYPLPDERIAKFPLSIRDQSKLLVYRQGRINEDVFTSLPNYLTAGSLMIFNNTKVIQARLHFHKETGALIEVFCLEPVAPSDYVLAFQQTRKCSWLCMIGNLKKWKEGKYIAYFQAFTNTYAPVEELRKKYDEALKQEGV
ncbi:MAG: S-adenosylmethionine:tRNA ribosyltransferase-isomerase, partial [Bacteroides sp.]